MKLKNLSFLVLIALTSCSSPTASYNEYPEYTGSDLGVTYAPAQSFFRTWSPAAEEVQLAIYDAPLQTEPVASYSMQPDVQGTWVYTVTEDLIGKYYTFQIKQDGKWYDPAPGIWAKAVGVNGERAAIIDWNATNPEGWDTDSRPVMNAFTDAVIYEVHMRDFTVSPTSGSHYPGKFLGLSERGTHSPEGLSTGLDHLLDLGITHVQILPSYDYGSIDETRLADNKYNWGYDPKNYNVPEGGYSTDPYNPVSRILEMKTMIRQLHQAGIRVIMDVVYNHTFVNEGSHLYLQSPGYFYRIKDDGTWGNGSGCGNETASERAMMRRYMVESVKYWVNEYHIDGFRFDLMGIHDIETMNAVRAALDEIDPSISIHGEGWAAGPCLIPEETQALKKNAPELRNIAVFSDDIRDALRGNWAEGNLGGFLTGNGCEEIVKFGVVGATAHPQIDFAQLAHSSAAYAVSPSSVINYVSCHDDPCVVDKLLAINPDFTNEELQRMAKLAQTVVFTAQGVPFIYAGEEVLRDKKGVHNSFQSPDSVNEINWSNKAIYADYYAYIRNLIALRKAHPAFRMGNAGDVAKAVSFLPVQANLVAYTLNGTLANDTWSNIFVAYNGNTHDVTVDLPEGVWTAACYDGSIYPDGKGCYSKQITVPQVSAVVLFHK